MGPMALAVCESQTLSYDADEVTYRLTWNKHALFASSSFLYQLPITYYAGWFNVITAATRNGISIFELTWIPGKKVDSAKPTRKRIAQRVEKFLLNARHMVRELQINSIVGI